MIQVGLSVRTLGAPAATDSSPIKLQADTDRKKQTSHKGDWLYGVNVVYFRFHISGTTQTNITTINQYNKINFVIF